eukprot:6193260-Pleurochrysis_carterae.AAC.1
MIRCYSSIQNRHRPHSEESGAASSVQSSQPTLSRAPLLLLDEDGDARRGLHSRREGGKFVTTERTMAATVRRLARPARRRSGGPK